MATSRLCTKYEFEKPNDRHALDLMNAAAIGVMEELSDIRLAYGVSDEFRYVLDTSDENLAILMKLAASFSVDLVIFSKDERGM